MSRARIAALAVVLLALAAAGLALNRAKVSHESEERPRLLFLSSLPILFAEEFSLEGSNSPMLTKLQEEYQLVPIDVTDPASLAKARLLLMAQPRAQPPENLVALDHWVREGGHVLLLADPALEWPSAKAPSDVTRPPRMFADTGLLGHWGLRLDAPDQRGPVIGEIAGNAVSTTSVGTLSGRCKIEEGGLVARCRIGRGTAVVVSDADLLNLVDLPQSNGEAVMALLDSLVRK
jgi:hypothetical protein